MKIYVSCTPESAAQVARICHCLQRQALIELNFFPQKSEHPTELDKTVEAIKNSQAFITFISEASETDKEQASSFQTWLDNSSDNKSLMVSVVLGGVTPPHWLAKREYILVQMPTDDLVSSVWAIAISVSILKELKIPFANQFDDLPVNLEADYEKDMVQIYKRVEGIEPELIAKGYPPSWPDVIKVPLEGRCEPNPLDPQKFGEHRSDEVAVCVDARIARESDNSNSQPPFLSTQSLTFPEAGPRKTILHKQAIRAGVLVSGGIAPGINAVISGIVERHARYQESWKEKGDKEHSVIIKGFIEGFRTLCSGQPRSRLLELRNMNEVIKYVNEGGSILPTARADELLDMDPVKRQGLLADIAKVLHDEKLDIIYVIGGEGSMRAAHAIWNIYSQQYPISPLSVVCVPKTMDNDILWVWQSFGFLSAVEKARENIIQLYTEVTSNPRVGIVQLFGSASGYVVSHAALGSNVCSLALIPEMDFSMVDVCHYMENILRDQLKKNEPPAALVVMAESAVPNDYDKYRDESYVGLSADEIRRLDEFKKKGGVLGQTPDELRSGSLRIVSRVLERYIRDVMGAGISGGSGIPPAQPGYNPEPYWKSYRVLVNEPRHIIRSMAPSVTDVAFGVRLGTMAVDTAMAGYTDCMVSQWLTEYVVVPLKLVVLGRKLVPPNGIFWKTVVSKTGQMQFPGLM